MQRDPATAAVRRAVRESLTGIPAGDLVLAAVSGGADSLALAFAVAAEAPAVGLRAGAVTVDHRLQAGSDARARDVADWATRAGLAPVVVATSALDAAANVEARAREVRYAAFDRVLREQRATALLLGHTLDDQAETVLLGLARGSGARSLGGMPARRGAVLRPLLGLERVTVAAAAQAWGLPVWHDPHNVDRSFARVRVRLDLLPALEAALGPGVARALARTAEQLRDDADALDEVTDDAECGASDPDDDTALVIDALADLPRAVRTRLLRRLALRAGAPATDLTAGHVAAMERLVTGWHGQQGVDLPGGLVASRAYGRLRVDERDPGRDAAGP